MMAASRFFSVLHFLMILLLIASTVSAYPAKAQGDEASELINLINALRISQGLDPYSVDAGLMALAQEHSDYQASIHKSTHQHSDGKDPPDLGVVENVAGGDLGYLEPQAAVYEIWADPGHLRTMTGFPAGSMGVGVANDGKTAYYTLEVRPLDSAAGDPGPSSAGQLPVPSTSIPIIALVTLPPRPDGTIVHEVGYGQTLWAIALAYGVKIEQIRAWNNIPEGSNEIFAGQRLLVRPASLVTTTPALNPGATQSDSAPAPALPGAAERETTPPPTSTPVFPDPAALRPAGAGQQDGTPPPPNQPEAAAEPLIPLIAGISILLGCMLLLMVRIPRKSA